MFIRIVWRLQKLTNVRQTLREMQVSSSRDTDSLGITGPDFSNMTRGLFDE